MTPITVSAQGVIIDGLDFCCSCISPIPDRHEANCTLARQNAALILVKTIQSSGVMLSDAVRALGKAYGEDLDYSSAQGLQIHTYSHSSKLHCSQCGKEDDGTVSTFCGDCLDDYVSEGAPEQGEALKSQGDAISAVLDALAELNEVSRARVIGVIQHLALPQDPNADLMRLAMTPD